MADPINHKNTDAPAAHVEAAPAEKETGEHLRDYVLMKAPGPDGEMKRVSVKGDAISKKMFAGYRQVNEKGEEL